MISIIICSVNPELLKNIKENINNTINIPYEIIAINNSGKSSPISEVYNRESQNAKYDYLVFLHEDIKFHSSGWGDFLIETLNKTDAGLLGICGGKYYPNLPCSWIDIPNELRRASMINHNSGNYEEYDIRDNPGNYYSETVTLDGQFLALKKSTWERFHFYDGKDVLFHFYDIDLSLKIGKSKKLLIDHRIKIEHLSYGKFDRRWFKDAFAYYRQRPYHLDISNIKIENVAVLNDFAFKRLLERAINCRSCLYLVKLFWIRPGLFIKNSIFLFKLINGNGY